MYKLAEHSPAFAFLFDQEPSLWMTWTLRCGSFINQRPEVRFSMNYWTRLYRVGRFPRIQIRANTRPMELECLVKHIPRQSLPFIYSLNLRVPFQSYVTYSFMSLLEDLPGLEELKLIVRSTFKFNPTPFHQQRQTFVDLRPIIRGGAALRSLSLNNMYIRPNGVTVERWSYITSLRLSYGLRRASPRDVSLYDLIFSAPNLTELSLHIAYALREDPFSETFFAVVEKDQRYRDWNPRLTHMEIKGAREHVPTFVESIISHPRAVVQAADVTFHYATDGPKPDLFFEMGSFFNIMRYQARIIKVDIDLMTIVAKMVDGETTVRDWSVSWKLCDSREDSWVCCRLLYSIRRLANPRQPEDKLLKQRNKFRFFASSIILDSCPPVIEVSVDGPATSLFMIMDEPCLVDTLHLTGQSTMYEAMLHYILQHSNLFPRLKFIHFHHRAWCEEYDPRIVAHVATQFQPPLTLVDNTRNIAITIDSTEPYELDVHKTYIDWILSSPSKSRITYL